MDYRLDEGGYNYKGYVIYRDYEHDLYHIKGTNEYFSRWIDAEECIDEMENEKMGLETGE